MKEKMNEFSLHNTELPDEHRTFTMLYKGMTFINCKRVASLITGSSPFGEIHLHTTVQMILAHDLENQTVTTWRYE